MKLLFSIPCIISLLWAVTGISGAQESSPSAPLTQDDIENAEREEQEAIYTGETGFVRIWYMGSEPAKGMTVTARSKFIADKVFPLGGNFYPYYSVGYRPIPAGKYKIEISGASASAGEPLTILKGDFYTLLFRSKSAPLEVIEDRQAPRMDDEEPPPSDIPLPPPPKRLIVYQFTDQTIRMESAGNDERELESNSSYEMAPGKDSISLSLFYGEPEKVRSLEIDLGLYPDMSLLITHDPYGRVTSRVVKNGTLD